ncbi:MAG: hypothetical protein ACRBFS_11700 [Aureispira sp.]
MLPRFLFFLLIIVAIFSACEKQGTVYIKRIDNQTTDTLNFYFFGLYNTATYGDTLIVLPNENKSILYFAEEGGLVYGSQGCTVVNDSIAIEIDGGRVLLKDLRKEDDWDYTEVGSEQICTFEVTPSDIQ